MDESTANLDPENEAQVLDNLFAHRRGKTTILISHRPQITQRADWVVMLDRGRVQWQGAAQEWAQRDNQFN